MQNLFVLLFIISFAGLIVSALSALIYHRYHPKKSKATRDKISVYRPAFMLIFLALMAISTMGWQTSRYDSVSSASTTNSDNYINKLYPVYDNSYDLASVIDDNIVAINIKGQSAKVKLIGVKKFTAKTLKQNSCFSRVVEARLNTYLKGKEIQLEGDDALSDKDKNKNLLRYVSVNDENINKKLISAGYAIATVKGANYKYLEKFLAAQKSAKAKKLGLWSGSMCPSKPIVASASASSNPSTAAQVPDSKDNPGNHGRGNSHSNHGDNNSCHANRSVIGSIVDGFLFRHC